MKFKNVLPILMTFSIILFSHNKSYSQFTFATDDATQSPYSDGFGSGDNGGTGFNAWSITYGGSTGSFVGNPSNDGMGTTGIGTSAWGFFATGSDYINALRTMTAGMQFGDELTFYWAMNFDAGGGSKGFDLKNGGTTIFNVNNTGNATITTTNGTANSNYGTTPMLVTLTRTSSSEYSFSMTSRSGDPTYSTTFSSAVSIDGVNIYSGNQNDGAGQKNIYFNSLVVQNDGNFDVPSGSETYTKSLTGTSSLTKSGDGTLVLTAFNPYSGTTTVSGGTLKLQNSLVASDVTVQSGATLEIDGLVVLKSLTVEAGGTAIVNSGKSLIVSGTSAGDITYNRNLGTDNWYLISSPFSGETIEDFIANHTLASGTVDPSHVGLAPYVNDGTAWDYQTATSTGAMGSGTGYSVKLAAAGDISFTGSMATSDFSNLSLSDNSGSGGNAFNLVGNPYPSFIDGNIPADAAENILTINSTLLTEETIWLWNQASGSYEEFNQASSALNIAPCQGFFVSANGNASNFTITEGMQRHLTPDTFQRINSDRTEIQLVMTDGTMTRDADIYFINGTSTGFDNGYDSSIFGGVANNFAVYTHAVANGEGRNLGIQSLPDSNYEDMVIPVGVNADAGTNLTFTANVMNLPPGLKVILEDTQTNNFSQLDVTNGEYNVTLDNAVSGIGRFYLHTTAQVLEVSGLTLNNLSVYTSVDKSILNIVGLDDGKAFLALYDLTGKRILDTAFKSKRVNTIALPKLKNGIYIVRIESENGSLNKKIVIN